MSEEIEKLKQAIITLADAFEDGRWNGLREEILSILENHDH